jgi:hypothetical protein
LTPAFDVTGTNTPLTMALWIIAGSSITTTPALKANARARRAGCTARAIHTSTNSANIRMLARASADSPERHTGQQIAARRRIVARRHQQPQRETVEQRAQPFHEQLGFVEGDRRAQRQQHHAASAATGRNTRRPMRNTSITVAAPPAAWMTRTRVKSRPKMEYTRPRKYGYSGPMKKAW